MKPLPFREMWERELRDGVNGQDRQRPSTWKLDGLYHAVCWQIKSEEAEEFVRLAMSQNADAESVAALLGEVHGIRHRAKEIFVEHEKRKHEAAA